MLAHEVESLLDLARNHELRLESAIITEILRSRDALQAHTRQISFALEKGKLPSEIVPVSHLMKSVRRLAAQAAGRKRPSSDAHPAEERDEPAPEEAKAPAPAARPARAPSPPVAPPLAGLAALAAAAQGAPATPVPKADAAAATASAQSAAPSQQKDGASHTVRVSTEKLDSLMDVVGELVIVQSQLVETTRGNGGSAMDFQRNVTQLGRITKELQHTAMSLRMIPIKPSFQKMERLARDLARTCGRKVTFTTAGEDTELDRTMVEEIADPLVHMVRNAVDHGLEPPEERLAKGKPEAGLLTLSAYHQGSNIVIELKDDGRGIDPDRVLKKAQALKLIPENSQPTREEILRFIFLPGFSTAEKVTSVSGRGVGMDVVKRNIDKLRGKIEIESAIGAGSTFKIKLPLTMAIIDGLVLKVGEDRFIIPSTSVQMALRPARETISRVQGSGEMLDLRGRLLPLYRLYVRLGIPCKAENPWEGIVLVVEASGKTCALLVDEMVSKQEVVIKNLGAIVRNLPGVSGAAILGDGTIALILDPGTLLNAA
jgi:two-component system chemotaxis sensor kinase CheA